MTIKAVDTVRTPADMKPADLEGVEGRWLDVPRLQQRNKEGRSNFWCGRAAAAMIYNYYCKFGGKTDQYVGHEDGDKGPGLNGQKLNLRYLGGPKKGKFAGIDKDGYCHPQGIFEDSGWKSDSGELASSGSAKIDVVPSEIEKRFSRHVEQIKKNNPVVQFTQLTKNRGHIVVVCGYKKDARGDLWLRIADPCWPHEELLQTGNYVLLTKPEKPDKEFSEYWVKAGRLLEMYPKRSTRLYAHADKPGGHFFYVVPDKPVPDDHELVHKLTRGGAEAAGGGAGSTSTSTSGAGAGAAPAAAALPPKTGSTRLPFALDGKTLVTGEALAALYHQTERGVGGFFPLGDAGLFHS